MHNAKLTKPSSLQFKASWVGKEKRGHFMMDCQSVSARLNAAHRARRAAPRPITAAASWTKRARAKPLGAYGKMERVASERGQNTRESSGTGTTTDRTKMKRRSSRCSRCGRGVQSTWLPAPCFALLRPTRHADCIWRRGTPAHWEKRENKESAGVLPSPLGVGVSVSR